MQVVQSSLGPAAYGHATRLAPQFAGQYAQGASLEELQQSGGLMAGAGGLMQGASGLMQAGNGLMQGAGGLVQGAGGLVQGAGGLVQASSQLVQGGPGSLMQTSSGLVQGGVSMMSGSGGGMVQGASGGPGMIQGGNGGLVGSPSPVDQQYRAESQPSLTHVDIGDQQTVSLCKFYKDVIEFTSG